MRTRYLGAFGTSITLHLVVVLCLTWVGVRAAPEPGLASARDGDSPVVTLVPSAELSAPPAANAAPPASSSAPEDLGLRVDAEDESLKFQTFTFDVGKIVRRAGTLFPFLTRDFARDPIAPPPRPRAREQEGMRNPFGPRLIAVKPPLVLDDAALQAVVDESWSRRHRWSAFQTIAAIADGYSPDEGRLPSLLREYAAQNGLQPYDDPGIRDPRLWAQLGLVADHTDFITFVSGYAAQHPSTRATTELLFLLEKLAQASLDTLVTMDDIEPARDLRWTRAQHPSAYEAIVAIRQHYRDEAARLGIESDDELRERFAAVRLAILENILRTTPDGYRANDARFLIGAIHWKQRRRDEAMRAWRDLQVQPGDGYREASAELIDVLREADGELPSDARVRRLLETEQGRWLGRAYDRLRRFGYRFDTF